MHRTFILILMRNGCLVTVLHEFIIRFVWTKFFLVMHAVPFVEYIDDLWRDLHYIVSFL